MSSNRQWLDRLLAAVVEEEFTRIERLLGRMPEFDTREEALEARALIEQAMKAAERERANALEAMRRLERQRAFLADAEKDPGFMHYS